MIFVVAVVLLLSNYWCCFEQSDSLWGKGDEFPGRNTDRFDIPVNAPLVDRLVIILLVKCPAGSCSRGQRLPLQYLLQNHLYHSVWYQVTYMLSAIVTVVGCRRQVDTATIELPVGKPAGTATHIVGCCVTDSIIADGNGSCSSWHIHSIIAPAIAAVVPLDVNEPIWLFWIEMVPVDEELIPTTSACVVEDIQWPGTRGGAYSITGNGSNVCILLLLLSQNTIAVAAPLLVVKLDWCNGIILNTVCRGARSKCTVDTYIPLMLLEVAGHSASSSGSGYAPIRSP